MNPASSFTSTFLTLLTGLQGLFNPTPPQEEFLNKYGLNIWCSCEEKDAIEKNDVLIRELSTVGSAKTSIILAHPTIAQHYHANIFNDTWKIYTNSSHVVLMIPPTLPDLEKTNNICLTNFKEIKPSEISSHVDVNNYGSMLLALEDLLLTRTKESIPCSVMLSGHGLYNKIVHIQPEQNITCGTKLGHLRDIFELLSKKNTKEVLYSTCYGGGEKIQHYIAQKKYSMPIISCCATSSDCFFSPRNSAESIQNFHESLHKNTNTPETKINLLNSLEHILKTKNCLENTPLVLWPQTDSFELLCPKQTKSKTSNQPLKKNNKTIFLEQPVLDFLKITTKNFVCPSTCHNKKIKIEHLEAQEATSPEELCTKISLPSGIKKQQKMFIKKLSLKHDTFEKVTILLNKNKKIFTYTKENMTISQAFDT